MIREFCVVGLSGIVLSSAIAGDLNPPPGPVVPSMKTLDEIEPRIAVNAQNTPGSADAIFVIDQPGSYYLTGNIEGVASMSGISIIADNVTLDLNGFAITGEPDALSGVVAEGAGGNFTSGITIRNGVISVWPVDGIRVRSDSCRIEDISFISNRTWAVNANSSFVLRLLRCSALSNGDSSVAGTGDGDFLLGTESHVRDCTSRSSFGVSFVANSDQGTANVVNCTSINPRDGGYVLRSSSVSMSNCTSFGAGNGTSEPASGFSLFGLAVTLDACSSVNASDHNFEITADSVAISGCASSGAASNGFEIAGGNSASLVNCTSEADMDGFSLAALSATLENCSAILSNGDGFDIIQAPGGALSTVNLTGCVANETSGFGFISFAENTNFLACTADNCVLSGFSVSGNTLLEGCTSMNNGGTGFRFANSNVKAMRGCMARGNGDMNVEAPSNLTIDGCRIGSAQSTDAVVVGNECVIKNTEFAVGCLTPVAVRVNGPDVRIFNNTIQNRCNSASGTGILANAQDVMIDSNTFEGFTTGIDLATNSEDCHIWRNFFNDMTPVVDNGTINVIAPILNDTSVMTATNPFANWDD